MSYWLKLDGLIERGKEMSRLRESLIFKEMGSYIFGDVNNTLNFLQSYYSVAGIIEVLKSQRITINYDAHGLAPFKLNIQTAKNIKDGSISIEKLTAKQQKFIGKLYGLNNGIILSHSDISKAPRWQETTEMLVIAEKNIIESLLGKTNAINEDGVLEYISDALLE